MDGKTIRNLRRRLGLTQSELGVRLGVDQGTVSRWERSLEGPRPDRAAALREMLMRDDDHRALARSLAIVRQDILPLPVALLDAQLRVVELSRTAADFMRKRGYDPEQLIGKDVHAWSERLELPRFPELLRKSGVLTGEALLLRFVRNDRGRGHVTVYEPIFAGGELAGILNFVTAQFNFDPNDASTLELVEVVPADNPGATRVIHAGIRQEAARAALRHGASPDR